MPPFVRHNALSIVLFSAFFVILIGQSVVGAVDYNSEREEHGQAPVGFVEYLGSGHFGEAVFENWESEFLQMGALVVLTIFLRQRGSGESKKEGGEAVDRQPNARRRNAPWPVKRGGMVLKLYENSLSIALLGLFAFSFALHAVTGAVAYSEDQLDHGGQPVTALAYAVTPHFWFESLQNWQSEFLAVGSLAVLTIYLRQRGSPESKPVDAPHSQTGSA
jgi:hypothetical protein